MTSNAISPNVIKRLPRYYRFLGELISENVQRISSGELAKRMGLTASQIRQDLNCFGGFGQQGFGYNVVDLHESISKILGLKDVAKAVLIGAGNLGKALSVHMKFEDYGFKLIGIFDKNEALAGSILGEIPVRNMTVLEEFCREQKPTIAILCIPKEAAKNVVEELIALGVRGFWNFTHYDIAVNHEGVIVENVHLSDSMMTLRYQMKNK